ncbi:hypothetical protein Trydic_g15423, partial [Trypoxylus dichotomus]
VEGGICRSDIMTNGETNFPNTLHTTQ